MRSEIVRSSRTLPYFGSFRGTAKCGKFTGPEKEFDVKRPMFEPIEGCILHRLIAALKILKGNLFTDADFIAHSTLVSLMHMLSFFRNQASLPASSGLGNV